MNDDVRLVSHVSDTVIFVWFEGTPDYLETSRNRLNTQIPRVFSTVRKRVLNFKVVHTKKCLFHATRNVSIKQMTEMASATLQSEQSEHG